MLTFEYEAKDNASGKKVRSTITADSEQSAAKAIRQQGLVPLEIRPDNSDSIFSPSHYLNRISTKDKVLFSRQLATLINAGLPLVQSLRNVATQTSNKKLKSIINNIITDVEAGKTLSRSLSNYPRVFDEVFVNLVAAGEASGNLDTTLERVANQQEKQAEIISKVRGAMAYPAIILMVMLLVVGFMVVKVLPEVKNIYQGLGDVDLPFVTKILLAVSDFTIKFWWIELIVLAVLAFSGTRWARTLSGKRFFDKAKLKVPLFGPLFFKLYMARFARVGATLVGSGLPLLQVLDITGKSVNNLHVADSLKKVAEKVRGGKALSDALKGDPYFLDLVPNMLQIGEQSGKIEEMLNKIADYYEKEVDNAIKTISSVIEPLLMVVLGVVALVVVAAVLLPIYSLAGKDNLIK